MKVRIKKLLSFSAVIAFLLALLAINGAATAQVADPRVTLALTSPADATVGSEFDVDVNIYTPGLDTAAGEFSSTADVVINFPADLIEVTSIVPTSYFSVELQETAIDNTNGQIHFIRGSATGEQPSGPGIIATITFNTKASGTADITFGPATQGSASPASTYPGNVVDELTDTTVTINGFSAAVPKLSLTSAQTAFVNGEAVTVDLTADTDENDVDGVDAHISFDPAVLEVISVTEATGTPFNSFPALDFDNTAGTIAISANVGADAAVPAVNGTGVPVAQIVFNAVSSGSTSVDFDFTLGDINDSNMIERTTSGDGNDILGAVDNITFNVTNPTPTPTATPSPTPTDTPTPTPTVPVEQEMTVKIQLEGRAGAGKSNAASNVTITAKAADETTQTFSDLSVDVNGNTAIDLLPGTYDLLVDVPTYLAKKFPVEVIEGNNTLDLTATPLKAGDFNDDTIINSVDYTAHYLNAIFTNNAVTDIDGSGQVNSNDFSILRRNWDLIDDIL